uniref:Uncharacterized protein n=1 Tax=Rhizophora mucronata TaxID=61149 RepID=A0A2P2P8B1_RHIMU
MGKSDLMKQHLLIPWKKLKTKDNSQVLHM